jgi:hypothetical protein
MFDSDCSRFTFGSGPLASTRQHEHVKIRHVPKNGSLPGGRTCSIRERLHHPLLDSHREAAGSQFVRRGGQAIDEPKHDVELRAIRNGRRHNQLLFSTDINHLAAAFGAPQPPAALSARV